MLCQINMSDWNYKKDCPNKNCMGGIITFDGQTGRLCKYCNPDKRVSLKDVGYNEAVDDVLSLLQELPEIKGMHDMPTFLQSLTIKILQIKDLKK